MTTTQKFQAPRGTADILPQDYAYWRLIEARAQDLCRLYGYERIDTPAFEEAGLFTRSIGPTSDIVEKETYTFPDRSGNLLTLRPEGTAPVCRAYIEHGLHARPQPVRLYYLASIFRYERPQKGRYRQHHQFGFEALGEADPALDAEVIDMAWRFFSGLGLKGLTLLLNSIGCPRCRPGYLEALKAYYTALALKLCPDCRQRLSRNPLRLLDCKRASCLPLTQAAPRSADHLCPECSAHFQRLRGYVEALGLPYSLEHRLVRGLDYYTRTVFEVQPPEGGAQSALGGGGRYDGLIQELGGRPTPGVGFAAGLERLALALQGQGVSALPLSPPTAFIAYLGEAAKVEALRLASELRRQGIPVILSLGERSLKAQLKQAHALGVPHALILGEAEVALGVAQWRDMARGQQQAIPISEIASHLFTSFKAGLASADMS